MWVSEIQKTPPKAFQTPLQQRVYETLAAMNIPFERVDTDEAITMEDCVCINERLDMQMVKTLFLCNRQQTAFYLFITAGDKPFHAKDFAAALDAPRPSFAPPERGGGDAWNKNRRGDRVQRAAGDGAGRDGRVRPRRAGS